MPEPKKSWRLSHRDRNEIVRAYRNREHVRSIAARFGVSPPYPGILAKNRGVRLRNARAE